MKVRKVSGLVTVLRPNYDDTADAESQGTNNGAECA